MDHEESKENDKHYESSHSSEDTESHTEVKENAESASAGSYGQGDSTIEHARELKKFGYYKPSKINKVSPLRDTIQNDLQAMIKSGKVDLANLPMFRSDLMLREEKKARMSILGEGGKVIEVEEEAAPVPFW